MSENGSSFLLCSESLANWEGINEVDMQFGGRLKSAAVFGKVDKLGSKLKRVFEMQKTRRKRSRNLTRNFFNFLHSNLEWFSQICQKFIATQSSSNPNYLHLTASEFHSCQTIIVSFYLFNLPAKRVFWKSKLINSTLKQIRLSSSEHRQEKC